MNEAIIVIVGLVVGIGLGLVLARMLGFGGNSASSNKQAEEEAQQLIDTAKAEVDEIKKRAQVEGKELAFQYRDEIDKEIADRKKSLRNEEDKLNQLKRSVEKSEKTAQKRETTLEKRERQIDSREKSAEAALAKAEETREKAKERLEEVAGLSAEKAKQRLEEAMRSDARAAVADEIAAIEKEASATAEAKSKEILATAIQRYASEFVQERTVSMVPLPSDDLKGRLIGREGRNIRALEAATGVDMIIDDTSGIITISCFNPVRREIARIAISKLVSDGRIHPTRIEEVVGKAGREIDKICKEAGEQAIFDLGLHDVKPDLMMQLGRLKYRSSHAQNILQQSIEVGFLAGLMASEVGIKVKLARRAGLFHAIGKSVDHELEGSYADVGAKLCRKYGESQTVCQAVKNHSSTNDPQSVLDHIIYAAHQLSVARPGARREALASYVERLEELESICAEFDGVGKAFALQSGREVRVMVENHNVSDSEAIALSKDIAKEIESRATYPGTIKVVVVRETRASDYAQ